MTAIPETPLRQARRERGLRLEDLAWLVKTTTGRDVSPPTLSRLERNRVESSAALKAAVARSLHIPPEDLFPVKSLPGDGG